MQKLYRVAVLIKWPSCWLIWRKESGVKWLPESQSTCTEGTFEIIYQHYQQYFESGFSQYHNDCYCYRWKFPNRWIQIRRILKVCGAHLQVWAEINAAIPGTADQMSKYHLQDVVNRIDNALNPKNKALLKYILFQMGGNLKILPFLSVPKELCPLRCHPYLLRSV